jgi:hypothetical protein
MGIILATLSTVTNLNIAPNTSLPRSVRYLLTQIHLGTRLPSTRAPGHHPILGKAVVPHRPGSIMPTAALPGIVSTHGSLFRQNECRCAVKSPCAYQERFKYSSVHACLIPFSALRSMFAYPIT